MSDALVPELPRLHFITDTRCQNRWNETQLARAVLEGGGQLIQYRDKFESSTRARLVIAHELTELCQHYGAKLIINDRADIASSTTKAGLHLGPTDLPISHARRLLAPPRLIGATVNSPEHAHALVVDRPDYVGIGPFRATSNKMVQPKDLESMVSSHC